jgi:predicted ATPase/class 3 adenylate cyclase
VYGNEQDAMSTLADQSSTFLFTDIEGSTRRWSRAREAMEATVQRQEALLRRIIADQRGTVFKSVGDGVYAVFPHAPDAIRAAVAAQRALTAKPWNAFETDDPVGVRIGVHTGEAESRDGDYFGPTLNRLSRLLHAGHGGQILITAETVTACGEGWPDGIVARDLGERTLRDIPGSGRIYQLVAEGLPEQFPPLETLDPRVHNLPRWSSAMVGREREAARLRDAVRASDTRMVTVLGTGGVGKTRLTTEVAAQLLDEFQDGIRFVDLSAMRAEGQVVAAIVQVTGATDPLMTPKDALLDWLRDRELLLVLDNCEQVVADVAAICSEIVREAPGVTLLATSRAPIRIRGERQLALDPLPVDGDPSGNSAVQLFAERAREVNQSFALDPENVDDVTEICRMVDGLPLAIELAAAWVRVLSPVALQRRLQDGRAILRDGARDLPDRQRTLTNTIAWSYDLLPPEDQRAFRRLAVFRGGIAVDAAAAVIWESPVEDPLWALSRLDALVQANLLQVAPDPSGEPRFLMLQTIQEFAIGVLRNSGEGDEAATSHAAFFAGLAEEARRSYHTKASTPWLDRLELDFENLRAAVEFYVSSPEANESGLRLVVSLAGFLEQRNYFREARSWFEKLYRDDISYPPELSVQALFHWGNTWFSEPSTAGQHYRRAIGVANAAGMPQLGFQAIASLSIVATMSGDYETALSMANEVISFGDRESIPRYQALGHYRIANAACEAGKFDQVIAACNDARAIYAAIADPDDQAWVWTMEGRAHRRMGNIEQANHALDHALTRFQEVGDQEAIGMCELERGLAMLKSDTKHARLLLDAAVYHLANVNDAYSMIALLEGAAQLRSAEGTAAGAPVLLGAAQRLREQSGIVVAPSEADTLQRINQRLSTMLGPAKFDEQLELGRHLSARVALERYAGEPQ